MTLRFLAVLAVVAALASGCSKDKDTDGAAPKKRATTTTATATAAVAPTLTFTVTETNDNGTKGPDEAQLAAIRKTLDGWLAAAVVAPLHTGQPAPDLAPLFTAPALAQLADPAVRATVVDEGLPPATTSIAAEIANVLLSTVAGPDEVLAVVGARIDVKIHAVGPTIDVDVVHQGELVLAPEADGTWRIESFALHTARDSRA
jgi:type IV pilus biogenesis protein CpaD/CtpE